MKNSALKNLNFKKATLICFLLFFSLACLGQFIFSANNKSQSVSAVEATESFSSVPVEDREYELKFGPQKTEDQLSANAIDVTGTHCKFTSSGTLSTVYGGTTFTFSISGNNGSIVIKPKTNTGADGTQYTVTVAADTGYKVIGFKVNNNDISLTSYTSEQLDSGYSGNINIVALTEAIPYDLTVYYENSDDGISSYTITNAYSKEHSLVFEDRVSKDDLTNAPEDKILDGWLFWESNATGAAPNGWGYSYSNSVLSSSNFAVKLGFDSSSFSNNQGIFQTVTEISSGSGYSWGEIAHTAEKPIFIAKWKNTYEVNIYADKYNYDNTGKKGYWDDLDVNNINNLRGVYTTNKQEYSISDTIVITSNMALLFDNSLKEDKGSAFWASSKIVDKMPTVKDHNDEDVGYVVYNYGHYVSGWTISVKYNSGYNNEDTYYFSCEDGFNSTDQTSVKIENLNSIDFSTLAADLDVKLAGKTNVPATIHMYPTWSAATIINSEFGVDGRINFGDEYKLTEYIAMTDEILEPLGLVGKTHVAYKFNNLDGSSAEDSQEVNLIAMSGVWNYCNIDGSEIGYTSTSAGEYTADISPFGLDNVYKVILGNVNSDGILDNCYELEDNFYSFRTEESSSNCYIPSNFVGNITAYSAETYPLVDNYILSVLNSYVETYNALLEDKDNEIFNKVYYTAGSVVENSEDKVISKVNDQQFYIYIANNHEPNLPMFKSKYYTTILWDFGDYDLPTEAYVDNPEQTFASLKTGDALVWSFGFGQSASAKYSNKLNLYYKDQDVADYSYTSAVSYIAVAEGELDFSSVGVDIEFNNYVSGGWVFNKTVATNDRYTVNVENGYITAVKDGKTTHFYISGTNQYDTQSQYYYISKVWGDVFIQDDSNPIITMKLAYKYNLTIDNSGENKEIYWETKGVDNNLYGAAVQEDVQGSTVTGKTISFTVADNYKFAYPIITSEANDGTGLSFYKLDNWEEKYSAGIDYLDANNNLSQDGEYEKYYYVYNYGFYISKWEIKFDGSFAGYISYSNGKFAVNIGTTVYEYTVDDVTKELTIADVVRAIDDYMLINNITTAPSITMTPIWNAVSINVTTSGSNLTASSIQFGNEYTLTDGLFGQTPLGKSFFTYSYLGNDANSGFIARNNGVWNYQNIAATDFDGYTKGSSVGAGAYTLNVFPCFLDNLYKITLDNAKENESGIYQLSEDCERTFAVGEFGQTSLSFANSVYNDSGFGFEFYNSSAYPLIDDYIDAILQETYDQYSAGVMGNFDLLHKVFASAGTLVDDTKLQSNGTLYIYLANNQAVQNLPEFEHELSMLIHWNVENDVYTTTKYNDRFANEVSGTPTNQWVVNASTPTNVTATAHYVYSVKMYYFDTDNNVYNFVNSGYENYENREINLSGWFGNNTIFGIYNNELTGTEKHLFKFELDKWPTNKTFERWIFDVTAAGDSGYTVDTSNSGTLIVTKGSDRWEITYYDVNDYTPSLYYISSITGATRFVQNGENPIIKAKWATSFALTIDNTVAYWNSFAESESNGNVYGAVSNVDLRNGENFNKVSITIANTDNYQYPFMISNIDAENALSFYYKDEIPYDNYAIATGTSNYYYIYNYGHYISGYQLKIDVEGNTFYFYKEGNSWNYYRSEIKTTSINQLIGENFPTLLNFAERADELAAAFNKTAELTLIPVWEEVNISIVDSDGNNLVQSKNTSTMQFASSYSLKPTTAPTGQKLMHYYYGDSENNIIASVVSGSYAGIWNYSKISKDFYTYEENVNNSGLGAGTYTIVLSPFFVDNIYKVNLTNATVVSANTYRLECSDFTFNNYNGSYSNNTQGDNELTFLSSFGGYTFENYNDYSLMDSYIEIFKTLKATYLTGINTATENANQFDIFKKVYYTQGTPSSSGATDEQGNPIVNDTLTVQSTEQNFHIYLANNQNTGKLPMFKKDYYALIYWKNTSHYDRTSCILDNDNLSQADVDKDNKLHYIYTTDEYRQELHSSEIYDASNNKRFMFHLNEGDFDKIWKLEDGYGAGNAVTFEAFYYRKNYQVEVSTINKDNNNTVERRGYVRLFIYDTLYEQDKELGNTGGDYLIIFNGNEMEIYNYNPTQTFEEWCRNNNITVDYKDYISTYVQASITPIIDNDNFVNSNNKHSMIRLYEGCSVAMQVFDQGKDATSMARGYVNAEGKTEYFDDIIGYKFSKSLVQEVKDKTHDDEKNLFGDANEDNAYIYSVDPEIIKNKEYTNKDVLQVFVQFERIIYTLNFEMEKVVINDQSSVVAGEFSVLSNDVTSGYRTSLTINDITVQSIYKMDYYAYAGFKLETEAFVLDNNKNFRTLQIYDEENGEISQEYILTRGYYKDNRENLLNSLDGTWLREYFYVDYDNYDVELIELGTLNVKTCPIDFTLGLKIYDATQANDIIETNKNYNTNFALNENTGRAKTPTTSTYLNNDLGFYYYVSLNSGNYAVLNSRMFIPKNYLKTKDNFYTTYPFLLTQEPLNQAELNSSILMNMVENYESGKIISLENRNIFVMLEVRKLLTVDMQVAELKYDSNTSVRQTTLSNADNNNASIIVEPNADSEKILTSNVANILGYYKTSNGETVVRAYTYFGLENNLTSSFDEARYSRVEYLLNTTSSAIENNKFTLEDNCVLTIKYVPTSLSVEFVYTLDGEVVSQETMLEYIKEEETYKPQSHYVYYIGDYVTYYVECINPDYLVAVTINEDFMGQSDVSNTIVKCIKYNEQGADESEIEIDNRYLVKDTDYAYGKIQIVIDVTMKESGMINIAYQLQDSTKKYESDDYGTFTVYEDAEIKAENVSTAKVQIIDARDVYVKLNLPVGYEYVGIKAGNNSYIRIDADNEGLIKIIGAFDPAVNSGEYRIIINKKLYSAVLNTSNINKNSSYSIMNTSTNSDWTKLLTDVHVGAEIAFKSAPCEAERLDYFYYNDSAKNKHKIEQNSTDEYVMFTITSAMLEEVNSDVIDFGVEVVARFKIDIKVTKDQSGEDYIIENGLKLKIKSTNEDYIIGTYLDVDTEISLSVEADVTGKYDINLKEANNNIEEITVDLLNITITLNKNYNITITVKPKLYNINIEEYLYTNLSAVRENEPDTRIDVEDQENDLDATGQNYNDRATITFVKKTDDRELTNVFISNNDNLDMIMIQFVNDAYVAFKVTTDGKETISLSDYGYEIKLTEKFVSLSYITYNNIDIRFDYKLYKIIEA